MEDLCLNPFSGRLLELESRGDELTFTQIRVELADDLYLFSHLGKVVEAIEEEGLWGPLLLTHLEASSRTEIRQFRDLYSTLFRRACRVFKHQILLWMTQGRLEDPGFEFFVQENLNPNVASDWNRFDIVPSLVPRHLKSETVDKILFVGKCAQLLRHAGSDESVEVDPERLDASVEALSLLVTGNLWSKLIHEYNLLEMFAKFRSLHLLGLGHVFHSLARHSVWLKSPKKNADRELSRAWKECYSTVGTETVIWDGNYANGWDGVGIGMAVEWPLSLVFSPSIVSVYQSVFQILFKLLRTEVATTQAWWHCRNHSILVVREAHRTMAMTARSLRRHLMTNVVEKGYRNLILGFQGDEKKNFSDVLSLHGEFLKRMQAGLFLTEHAALRRAMDEWLETVLAFCSAVDDCNVQQEEQTQRLNDFARHHSLFRDLLSASQINDVIL